MEALLKDILNRVGTKAIVVLFGIYLLYSIAMKEGLTVSPLWFAGGIVLIILSFLVVKVYLKEKNGNPTNPPTP